MLAVGREARASALRPVRAFCPGIYARSERLVAATREVERGRRPPSAVEAELERDRAAFIELQETAQLDLLSDGLLGWQDLFRPLAERCVGVQARPLTRFLETNTFFRAWIVEGRPRLVEPVPAPPVPAGRWVGTLPSPFALSVAAGRTVEPKALAAEVLAPQVAAWLEAGAALLVLQEPFLAREPEALAALAGSLAELPGEERLALQLPFANAAPLLGSCAELPVAAIGVDFVETRLSDVPQGYPKELLAGVIDVRSSRLEEPGELAAFAAALMARGPAGLALTPTGDLQFVPEPIAREKVARLGLARALARGGEP